jgi:hypothetical protein
MNGNASSGKYGDPDGNFVTHIPDAINGWNDVLIALGGAAGPAYNDRPGMGVSWQYNCNTGLVDFKLSGGRLIAPPTPDEEILRASASVSPDWYLAGATLTAHDPLMSDVTVTTSCVNCDCPPQNCGSLDCFPDCISNTQDCDGVTPSHAILFGLVEWSGGAEVINIFHDESNWVAEIDLGGECGVLSISIGCSAGVDQLLTWIVRIAGVPTYGGSELLTLACVDGEVEAEINITSAACDITLTLFSNNAGLIP